MANVQISQTARIEQLGKTLQQSLVYIAHQLQRLLTDTPHDFLDQPIGLLCHTFPHVWDEFNAFTLKSDRFIGLSV